jgi:hypothetical protein
LPPPIPPVDVRPNYDGLEVALAQQGNAIAAQANWLTSATIIFAVVALVAAVSWAWFVRVWAKSLVEASMADWKRNEAQAIVAKIVADLIPEGLDGTGPANRPLSQREQEEGLGGDPVKEPG